MRRLCALALGLAALSPAAQADRTYAGLEIGSFDHEIAAGGGGNVVDQHDLDYAGLKVGRVSDAWRAYGTLHLPDTSNDNTVWWLTGSYDYLFAAGSPLQPFLGGHLGYYRFDSGYSDLTISSVTLGPEVGLQLRVDPFLGEIGYRIGFGLSGHDNRSGAEYDLDHADSLYVGLSITF
ncbi:MAG TPA: hypothetical protein VKA55_11670 [Gammaproteobacteria bacterium]|nr:hypothetical protein [Gammaproteobacteria bacterium]